MHCAMKLRFRFFFSRAGREVTSCRTYSAGTEGATSKRKELNMAKKDIQDDVLGNKFSLMNAKSSKLLSSWMGAEATIAPSSNEVSDSKNEDTDLKQADFGHDRHVWSLFHALIPLLTSLDLA